MALLVTSGIAWKVAAPKVLAGVQGLLLSQVNSSINGRLEIEALDFSILGSAVLKKVTLFDKAGVQIAASDEISISYKFADLIGGRFGIDSVKTITAEKVKLSLSIDKAGKWSLQDLVKPQAERPSVFRGSYPIEGFGICRYNSKLEKRIHRDVGGTGLLGASGCSRGCQRENGQKFHYGARSVGI